MKSFVGKFLIRRAKTTAGKEVFIIAGTALPQNFPITDIKDNDELWVAELLVTDVKEYEQSDKGANGFHGGPEDFLAGVGQDVTSKFSQWKPKHKK
jgi:hypothetical protein